MIRRIILLVGILLLLVPAAAALAGGWVVVTLESLPDQIYAGQPAAFSFMVRQHGRTPIHNVEPKLTATNTETGQQIEVKAKPMKELGRFMVTVDFLSEGVWEWSIQIPSFNHTATFAPLTVLHGAEPAATAQTSPAALQWQMLGRWAGLALLVTAVILFAVSRRRSAVVPTSGD
jgi:hypothetical protein